MKQKSELFDLVHALEKHEKRFFRLFASIESGDHSYVKIFDRLAHQKTLNEEKARKQTGSSKNVYAVQKHYLFNRILDRVALLNPAKETELRMLLARADFLYRKGLYPAHEKRVRRIKQQAAKFEMYGLLLDILRIEHTNAWRKPDLEEAAKIMEEEKKILVLFNNQKQYTHLASEIITLLNLARDTGQSREAKRLNTLIRHPLLKDEKNALTFNSRYTLFHTLFTWYFIRGHSGKQYAYAKKANHLYATNPEKIELNPLQYLYSLHNLLSICNSLKRYAEAKICLDKLRSYAHLLTSEREKVWAFFTYHDNNLDFFRKTGRFAEGMESATKLIRELERTERKLDEMHSLLLLFDAAKIFFGAGDHKKCLSCMNKILDRQILGTRADLEVSVRVFYLLVHFEKGNMELLENLCRQAQKQISAAKHPYKFENVLLDFFQNRILPADPQKKLQEEFGRLKKQLVVLLKDKHERIPLEQFDYIAWADSKIENRSFGELVRMKAEETT